MCQDMCAECGADLRKLETNQEAGVSMIHAIPELKVKIRIRRISRSRRLSKNSGISRSRRLSKNSGISRGSGMSRSSGKSRMRKPTPVQVSASEAASLGKEDLSRLVTARKLVLLVDLDQVRGGGSYVCLIVCVFCMFAALFNTIPFARH